MGQVQKLHTCNFFSYNAATTCGEASLNPGCCSWNRQSCHVMEGNCYCDNLCNFFGDCCCDVPEKLPCVPDFGEIVLLHDIFFILILL